MRKILLVGLVLVLGLTACSLGKTNVAKVLTMDEAKAKAVDFVNNNLMQPGSEVSVKEITEDNGLYKMVINTPDGQEIDSFLTKDGKYFFPQVLDIKEIEEKKQAQDTTQNNSQDATLASIPKEETSKVELFVMSHCPYGTQIEKGILPALKVLGDKVDFNLRFCDYSMHGEKEVYEELNQYCIRENEPEKLDTYLECFLEDGNGQDCLNKAQINKSKLSSCTAKADKEFDVTKNFEDKASYRGGSYPVVNFDAEANKKYGITGSPSLVINGVKIQAQRDSASLLETICAGYKNPPEECNTKLSSVSPKTGFGVSGASAGSDAGCGG